MTKLSKQRKVKPMGSTWLSETRVTAQAIPKSVRRRSGPAGLLFPARALGDAPGRSWLPALQAAKLTRSQLYPQHSWPLAKASK